MYKYQAKFNEFYREYKNAGETNRCILFNLLPSFVDGIADQWGKECTLSPYRSKKEINGSAPLFECRLFCSGGKIEVYVITENGCVYSVSTRIHKTKGATWNGDDQYFQNFATDYVNTKQTGQIESMRVLNADADITLHNMENIACEIVSTLS